MSFLDHNFYLAERHELVKAQYYFKGQNTKCNKEMEDLGIRSFYSELELSSKKSSDSVD